MKSAAPSFRLDGKRALVTGAGRGIGLAISQAFAHAGAEVTLCSRTQADLDGAVEELRAQGLAANRLVADVTCVSDFATQIDALPAFDVVVNNAGGNRPKPLSEVSEDDYDHILGLNLRSLVFACKAVTGRMIAEGRGGSIINMSSQMGHVGAANRTLYCASKWAVEGFTKALAVELGAKNIRVNTICPTFIQTELTRPFFEEEGFRSSVLDKIKLGRLGEVGDVTGAAVFLASDASSLMTGSALVIDGGWTAE